MNSATGGRCPNYSGLAVSVGDSDVLVTAIRCNMWSCEFCAVKKAQQWRAALIDHISRRSSGGWSFWTITMRSWVHKKPKHERYEVSAKFIKNNWDKFAKRYRRMLGKFEYVRVLETHKTGVIHVHLLANVWLPDVRKVTRKDGSVYQYNKMLKKHATDCGFGYICDHRNLGDAPENESTSWHGGSVASYVTKYVTKDMAGDDITRRKLRVRKIQTSRGIKRLNFENERSWEVKSGLRASDIPLDKPVIDLDTGRIVTYDDFQHSEIYPPSPEFERWKANNPFFDLHE